MSGSIEAAHIFERSSHFIRIFASALHLASTLRIVFPAEAALSGICATSDSDKRHTKELLSFCMRWSLRVRTLKPRFVEAIEDLTTILNTKLMLTEQGAGASVSRFVHVCDPRNCPCGNASCSALVQRLHHAFKVLLLRQPRPASEARWASVTPAMAYFGAWGLVHGLASLALRITFTKPAEAQQGQLEEMLASGLDWKVLYQTRLSKAMVCLGHPDSVLHCNLAVIVGEPLHAMLFAVLKADSRRNPDLVRCLAGRRCVCVCVLIFTYFHTSTATAHGATRATHGHARSTHYHGLGSEHGPR